MKIRNIFDRSFIKFLAVGVANTLLSMVLMFLLEGLGYWASTLIAYIAGAILSFFLNRHFTFKSKDNLTATAARFALNVAVCYVLAYALAQPVVGWILGHTTILPIWQERIAKLFGMGLYTLINYIGQKFFAFHQAGKAT